MSECHKTDEEWAGFTLNDFVVLKKTGEYKFTTKCHGGEYTYTADMIDVQCRCGRVFNMKSRSFISNKPSQCRFCHKRKLIQTIGEECGTLVVQNEFHNRNKSGRSVLWFGCECKKCGGLSKHKADVFRQGESSCKNCRKSGRFVASNIRKRNIKSYFNTIKSGAIRRGKDFDIQIEHITDLLSCQSGKCALSGIPISIEDGTASLDRINNDIGYVRDNLQWVHRVINYMKVDLTQDEFIAFCDSVSNYKKIQSLPFSFS